MKTFSTLEAAILFIDSLKLPPHEIEKIERFPKVFQPYDVYLKWADCDIIAIRPSFTPYPELKPIFEVQKRWFGGPISASEALGMMPPRYITPIF